MAILKSLFLATLTAHRLGETRPSQPPNYLLRRDGNDRFPFCTTATNPDCIVGGKYVKPDLNISEAGNAGNNAYLAYLPSHTYTLSKWTNQKMPFMCYHFINHYAFNPADFTVHNVTYPDCPSSSPWVICRHSSSSPSVNDIAAAIGKIPATMRQAASAYLVFPESWHSAIEHWAYTGLIVGKGSYYFPTSLVHEHGHAVDCSLVAPRGLWSCYSSTADWRNIVNADGYAATAYGTTNHADNFADIGRVVLLENIYPGGIAGLFLGHPNLTQIAGQVAKFQQVAGMYYRYGTTCDLSKKFPFAGDLLVDVPTTTSTRPLNTATALPYGQCGGGSAYTGPTACRSSK